MTDTTPLTTADPARQNGAPDTLAAAARHPAASGSAPEGEGGGLSIFGVSAEEGGHPVVVMCFLDGEGDIIGECLSASSPDEARAVAAKLIAEAAAAEAGERPLSAMRAVPEGAA